MPVEVARCSFCSTPLTADGTCPECDRPARLGWSLPLVPLLIAAAVLIMLVVFVFMAGFLRRA